MIINIDPIDIKIIRPYVGVDEIRFKMSPTDVQEFWGPPASSGTNYLGNYTETRSSSVATYEKKGKSPFLIEVGFSGSCTRLRVHGVNLFTYTKRRVLENLLEIDQNAYFDLGTVVFLSLGISLTGYFDSDGDDSDWAATAFATGRWDDYLSSMARFSPHVLEEKFREREKKRRP